MRCNSSEQRPDSISPLVIRQAERVSKDVVNSSSLQAFSIVYAAAQMPFGSLCIRSELLAQALGFAGLRISRGNRSEL